MIFQFIRLIPAFYKLFRDYEMNPKDIRFSLEQYQKVICELTNNRMSKLNYYAKDIIDEVSYCFCIGCDMQEEKQT